MKTRWIACLLSNKLAYQIESNRINEYARKQKKETKAKQNHDNHLSQWINFIRCVTQKNWKKHTHEENLKETNLIKVCKNIRRPFDKIVTFVKAYASLNKFLLLILF